MKESSSDSFQDKMGSDGHGDDDGSVNAQVDRNIPTPIHI